jgi:uncharacterized membrane protein YcaP (DUF421 family)
VYLLEIVGRTLAVYAAVLALIRLGGRREIGQLTPFDLVFVLLVANAVQNAMVGPDVSLEGGLVSALTLFGANFVVARARVRIPAVRDIVEGKPLVLVKNGVIQPRALRRESLTEDDVKGFIVEHSSVDDFDQVDTAVLEPNGTVQVVTAEADVERTRRAMPRRSHR